MYKIPYDSNYGFPTYKPVKEYMLQRRAWSFKYETDNPVSKKIWPQPTTTKPTIDYYEYHAGWFSNIFIGPNRYNLQFQTAYVDTTYNPLNDKGKGNKIWFQYHSKVNTDLRDRGIYCLLEDMPLWAMTFGYSDYVSTQLGPNVDHETQGLVCIICPYTEPPMYDKTNPNSGYVAYDTNFGNGKMPSGRGQVPVYWQCRWRPMLWFQQQVLNDISKTGPYAYRDEYKNVQLTLYYNFIFNWGATCITHRSLKTPVETPESFPVPVDSLAKYKSLARFPWDRPTSSTTSTPDAGSLVKKLLKECNNNKNLMNLLHSNLRDPNFLQQPQKSSSSKKTHLQGKENRRYNKKRKKSKSSKRRQYSSSSSETSRSSSQSSSSSNSSSYSSSKPNPICT